MDWLQKLLVSLFAVTVSLIFPSAHPQPARPTPSPTPVPSIASPSITPMISPQNSSVTDFIYPNAQKTSESNGNVTLQSTDTPSQIMQWYQQKINSLNMHSVSNVQTNTNGNVVDVLDSSDGNKEVKVELHKNASDLSSTFTVTISTVSSQTTPSSAI